MYICNNLKKEGHRISKKIINQVKVTTYMKMAQKYANTKDKNILAVEYARYVLRHNTGTLNDYLEGTVFPFIINPVQRLEILDLIYIILSGFGSDYQALDCENINKLNHV